MTYTLCEKCLNVFETEDEETLCEYCLHAKQRKPTYPKLNHSIICYFCGIIIPHRKGGNYKAVCSICRSILARLRNATKFNKWKEEDLPYVDNIKFMLKHGKYAKKRKLKGRWFK